MTMRALVLGVGNVLRQDDGLGWMAVEALGTVWGEHAGAEAGSSEGAPAPEVEMTVCHQLNPEMAESLSRVDVAVVIDASTEGTPGEVVCREVSAETNEGVLQTLPHDGAVFTHQVTPLTLVRYARELFGRCARCYTVTVCGALFGLGEGLSAPVASALPEVVRQVRALLLEPVRCATRRKECSHA